MHAFALLRVEIFLPSALRQNLDKSIPPKKILPKYSSKKSSQKKIFQKNFAKKIPPKNPKNFSKIPNFENIQFPTSHLEAENPFGLAFPMGIFFGSLLHILS
jgi:hypothetical protein